MSETHASLINWPAEMPPYENFAAAVQGEQSRWNAIGLASGIVRDGERQIVTSGFANAIDGYPLVPNSLFIIASISKIYTSTLVMRLMEQGILDLDTPVVQYVPDFKLSHDDVRDAITIRHLLSHTSGFDGDRFTSYGHGTDAYDKAIAEFHTLTQWFAPGSFYSYNNAGFYLVGHIVQKLTGKAYEDVFTEELIKPLGLQHTFIMPDTTLTHPWALGHEVDRTKGVSLSTRAHLPRHSHPAGGVMQTIGDLLTFAQMHLNLGSLNGTQIISRENATLMQQPVTEADTYHRYYGIGWAVYDRPSGKSVGHGGSWGGFRTNLILHPKHNVAHATLGNSNQAIYAYQSIEKWVTEHELHLKNPEPDAITLTPIELSAYTGTYRRHDGRFDVAIADTGLRMSITGINEDTGEESQENRLFDLEPLEPGRFRVTTPESKGATVDFRSVPDATGTHRDLIRFSGRVAARES